ncbi:MAG: hypothetical protein KJ607_04125 [Bacteroidetes bacterium]|nr:hypothetical protein [Bacteroidota bacterium]
MVQVTGVAQAVSATTLQRNYFSDGIYHLIQNTYYRQRCGDIIISLAPGYIEDIACTTTHNSAYSYDTHIPLIWYGWKIKRSIIEEPISVTDIAPTISTLMNISFPNGCFGKPIPGLTQ